MENEASPSTVATTSPEGIRGWIESVILTASQTSVGQTLFKLLDSFLWAVEKSAQWSLPAHEVAAEENGKMFGKIELVRPLPWIIFLPGLVILRMIRVGLNVGAFVLGYPRIEPSGIVKFMQKSRRRLRAINTRAVKAAKLRTSNNRDKRLTMIEAKKALIKSLRNALLMMSCLDTSKSLPSPPPMKIRLGERDFEPERTQATPDEKSTTESVGSPMQQENKRRFSQVSLGYESTDESEGETLSQKIDRLAPEDSSEDPDFNPVECSTESSTSSSENDETEVSMNELKEIREQATEIIEDCEQMFLMSNWTETGETSEGVKRVDSSESKTERDTRLTNEFINGEVNSIINTETPVTVAPEEPAASAASAAQLPPPVPSKPPSSSPVTSPAASKSPVASQTKLTPTSLTVSNSPSAPQTSMTPPTPLAGTNRTTPPKLSPPQSLSPPTLPIVLQTPTPPPPLISPLPESPPEVPKQSPQASSTSSTSPGLQIFPSSPSASQTPPKTDATDKKTPDKQPSSPGSSKTASNTAKNTSNAAKNTSPVPKDTSNATKNTSNAAKDASNTTKDTSSPVKENSSTTPERKGNKHKKAGRRDTK